MILPKETLDFIRRSGRPWFDLPVNPEWEPGRVVRLRESGKDEGFKITVRNIVQKGRVFRVSFDFGDTRPERRFLAATWPDYTMNPARAMRDEKPPMPETEQEYKARSEWLKLAGVSTRPQFVAPRAAHKPPPAACRRCGVPLSPPARLPWTERERPRYCGDKCLLLATYEGRRGA